MEGHNSVSAGQLRSFVERIERLEEERRTLATDIGQVKAEAPLASALTCPMSVARVLRSSSKRSIRSTKLRSWPADTLLWPSIPNSTLLSSDSGVVVSQLSTG